MFERLLKAVNLNVDNNQKWLLMSMFISGLILTYAHPTLLKAIVSELPAQWIAFESFASSVVGLLIGMAWKGRIRRTMIRKFLFLAITESLCGFLLGLYLCFIEFNVWVFAIASLIYSTIISMFVGKCIMAFKAKMWVEKDREIYDNNYSIVGGFVCIVGYLLALVILPPLKLSLFLWAMCCILDDIGWIIVYIKNKEILQNADA